MGLNIRTLNRLLLPALVLVFAVSIANAQAASNQPAQQEVATASKPAASKAAAANVPVFAEYRGVKIGMTAQDVRGKLDGLKKGERQDFLVLSEKESAQIYYDEAGKVTAISIDYFDSNNAPSPDSVLGATPEAKADGSMYQLNRYSEAGYWVSYNRTAGDKPIVTITMQKM